MASTDRTSSVVPHWTTIAMTPRHGHRAARSQPTCVLEQVLRDGQVTFNAVARAWFHLCDESLFDVHRERCELLFPAPLSAFAEPRGGIIMAYFCKHLKIDAALTDIHTAAQLGESPPVARHGVPTPPARCADRWRAMRCASSRRCS